ncbi:transcription factor TFIIIC subunit tfc4 [Agyrium rufum]|nr:transcription factor TFIIIC subunit tfc4 [Agyrium rufum]
MDLDDHPFDNKDEDMDHQYPDPDTVKQLLYPWVGTTSDHAYGTELGNEEDLDENDDYEFVDIEEDDEAIEDNPEVFDVLNNPGVQSDTAFQPAISADEEDEFSSSSPEPQLPPKLWVPPIGAKGGRWKAADDPGRVPRKGRRPGPRDAIEPEPEFRSLHSAAMTAFVERDYDRAEDLVQEAILVNPEIFNAHLLLSEIHQARGDTDKAVIALFHGAHTRPRDVKVWMQVASEIIENAGENRTSALRDAAYCYNKILNFDSKNLEVRRLRCERYRELGEKPRTCLTDYKRFLKHDPTDTETLRNVAAICTELGDAKEAVELWNHSLKYCRTLDPQSTDIFDWSDVNMYAELCIEANEAEEGLMTVKLFSRWLLERGTEFFWDKLKDDDCEFDINEDRRCKIQQSIQLGDPDQYGLGLPLEIRTKLGILRLMVDGRNSKEALFHFSFLEPDDHSEGSKVFDYSDLYRDVADKLREQSRYQEAVRFYEPLQRVDYYVDDEYLGDLATCYEALSWLEDAEDCYTAILDRDKSDMENRARLARMLDRIGEHDRVVEVLNTPSEMRLRRGRRLKPDILFADPVDEAEDLPESPQEPLLQSIEDGEGILDLSQTPKPKGKRKRPRGPVLKAFKAPTVPTVEIYQHAVQLRRAKEAIDSGDLAATEKYKKHAEVLITAFRQQTMFFPALKSIKFLGYSQEAREIAYRTRNRVGKDGVLTFGNLDHEGFDQSRIPNEYADVTFEEWLDIFCEYALLLAKDGDANLAYEALSVAADANVFYHSPSLLFRIHVCWAVCALVLSDAETLCNEARFFMKDYQFTTDAYRFYYALNRLCDAPVSGFNSGPSQKFLLRQIKAMDYSLTQQSNDDDQEDIDEDGGQPQLRRKASTSALPEVRHLLKGRDPRKRHITVKMVETAAFTTRDSRTGTPITAKSLDVALLMLYGHVLYAGTSYPAALIYFYRAYALDPKNPMVLFSLGLGFIHYSLKRQSENRHYLILQGWSFLLEYSQQRTNGHGREQPCWQERMEAEVNLGRACEGLGVVGSAIGYYRKALEIAHCAKVREKEVFSGDLAVVPNGWLEDFTRDAALGLQRIYLTAGNSEEALRVTQQWLVLS